MQTDEYYIIEQCKNGDAESFAILVKEYQEMILNISYRMTGDTETARDIAQDSFISAYGAIKDFRSGSKFSTWLCSIAMNKCRDHLRSGKATIPLDDVIEIAASSMPNPEEAASRKQTSKELQKAINALPDEYREAVILKHIEGLDYKEMEAVLGVSVSALKVRAHRARELMRQFLTGKDRGKGSA